MKASEKYSKETSDLVVKLALAKELTAELENEVLDFCRILDKSEWSSRHAVRRQLFCGLKNLKKRSRHFKLIQGGNEFIARRSQANLTLIVDNEKLNQPINKGV